MTSVRLCQRKAYPSRKGKAMSANAALYAGQPASIIFRSIRKQNKAVTTFNAGKITDTILKVAKVTAEFGESEAKRLTIRVLSLTRAVYKSTKHFRSALGQIVNFFYMLQGEAAEIQAFADFDTLPAPFVRFDNLNYKEVKQAIQEFIFKIAAINQVFLEVSLLGANPLK